MNSFRNLDLADVANKVRMHTLNLQDYRMVTPSIAHVVITVTGRLPVREQLRASLAELFKGHASPVTSSFRELANAGTVATLTGFVKTAHTILDLDSIDTKKYKAMASNLMMDEDDKSLWEIRKGNSGSYLVKQGDEDLSELAYSLNHKRPGLATIAQVATASADPKEFAAYVDLEISEVRYGYVVGNENGKAQVLSFDGEASDDVVDVDPSQLVEVVNLQGDDVASTGMEMASGGMDRAAMIEYYKKAYSYAPDYIQKIIDMIDQHATA